MGCDVRGGQRIEVADVGETVENMVPDIVEVSMDVRGRLSGSRGARNRALRAVTSPERRRPGEVS